MLRLQAASDPLESDEANELIQATLSGKKTLSPEQLAKVRAAIPRLDDHLWAWVYAFTGVKVARNAVCEGHSAPMRMFADQVLTRPALSLWHGPRGGGKSFLSALDTHLTSRFNPRHGTRILGGSKAQSAQIYEAIRDAVQHGRGPLGSDAESIASLLKTEALYVNGSNVSILAASSTSVRGPHVPSLKLDEVDEIDVDLRESAAGMCMNVRDQRASILMTSTWHRMAGQMSRLVDQGRAGAFPIHTFCSFEILERCPDERSGPDLERCGGCALQPWCHADLARTGLPKAKRSDGHYSIDALIQKTRGVSPRVFSSDYLCGTPIASNVWFTQFDEQANVSEAAEYDPGRSVHCTVDCGVWTGALLMQPFQDGDRRRVHVFAEYLAEDPGAESAAEAILAEIDARCPDARRNGRLRVSVDQAGNSRTPMGRTVYEAYRAAGLVGANDIERWDSYPGSVVDTLAHLEALVCSADGYRGLVIHPRCRHLIAAFLSYARKTVGGQATDRPVDPQHPHEEMIDALRGGLSVEWPERRKEAEPHARVPFSRVF